MSTQLVQYREQTQNLNTQEILSYFAEEFKGKTTFSTSLGWEDQVLTHLIFSSNLSIAIFSLDTGRLFNETYSVLNSTREKYKKNIKIYFPDAKAVEQLLTEKGPLSFYESIANRKECCNIRKVEPLKRALQGIDCWITGLRAEQSDNRQKLEVVEWDDHFKLYKINPLANWTLEEVKSFINKNNVPYNPLHDRGFVSIGCAPCTRAVKENEDFRAGRWWWENNSKKECGLHQS